MHAKGSPFFNKEASSTEILLLSEINCLRLEFPGIGILWLERRQKVNSLERKLNEIPNKVAETKHTVHWAWRNKIPRPHFPGEKMQLVLDGIS